VPDASDRRRVVIQGVEHGKAPDLRHLFVPMMEGMAVICESYTDEQLRLIVGFMQRTGVLTESQIANMRQAIELPSHVQSKAPEAPEKGAVPARKPAAAKAAVRKR
jgi:hypothetical protein